jgi:protein TonB
MSRLERKKPSYDLRNYYTLLLEGGLILALLISIAAVKITFTSDGPDEIVLDNPEDVVMEEVIQTKQIETPPPPPRPPVPVEVPNDEIIEDDIIDIDAELDFDGPIDLPPPPPQEDEEEEEEIFVVVEQMPELKGGLAGLQKSVKYPDLARRAGIEGRVIIQFVVNEQGKVTNPRVVRGIGGGCDEEALRAVQAAKFTPGMQRGRPVRVQYSLPVVFKLAN